MAPIIHRFVLPVLSAVTAVGAAVVCVGSLGLNPLIAAEPADTSQGGAAEDSASVFSEQRGEVPLGRPGCVYDYFTEEVWVKVAERSCVNCHTAEGEAADTEFLLRDGARGGQRRDHSETLALNRAAFAAMATASHEGQSRLLLKVTGGLDHGGGVVLEPESTGYSILKRFASRVRGEAEPQSDIADTADSDYDSPPFFAGVELLDERRLLRRVTLSLAGRLPSAEELAAVRERPAEALDEILNALMREDAFFVRLKEGFNDILLTLGYDGVAENVLSYDHFNKTRHWYQKHDLSHIPEDQRTKAGYKLANDYRDAIKNEPLELIAYIVRNERPFTEIATADYIMVTPYSARGYGIYEELLDRFEDPEDPFEYIPTRLAALKSRNGKVQETATGYYPHSGLLSMFHYLRRYPSTDTNRNRLRARMYYQHFLGIDVMELAPRVTDSAAVDAQYANPTMEAADCVVCHKTIDPVAGLFQDYYNEDGYFQPRREGWFTDMFPAGFEGEALPDEEKWRALQWLGERTVADPRFAVAMVEHVYYILMGRHVLTPPLDIDDPLFASRRRAYREQRELINEVAERFVASDHNLKEVFKAWVLTPWYRADGLTTAIDHPRRQAELDDVGVAHLLGPEQLDRKLHAIFGSGWGRLTEQFEILYGGINSSSVTERITQPSGAMGAIQRMMANDIACKNVPRDFITPRSERRLFPNIEPDIVPGTSEAADLQIRLTIVELHQRILGLTHRHDDPEVDRTHELFAGIIEDAQQQEGLDPRESYFCRGGDDERRLDDPHYTLRGWRAVVTYLLRQHDFLYE